MKIHFLHTSDWHIGKKFHYLPEAKAFCLTDQRIQTIGKISQLATQKQASFILVSGDIFDHEKVTRDQVFELIYAMQGFAGIWILSPGNHDPNLESGPWKIFNEAKTEKMIVLEKGEKWKCSELKVVVKSIGLEDIASGAAPDDLDYCHIGMIHASMGVDHGLQQIRDLLQKKEFIWSYIACGDWHGVYSIHPQVWYSGTPEPDQFKEQLSGSVLDVSIDPLESVKVTPIAVGKFLWKKINVTVSSEDDLHHWKAKILFFFIEPKVGVLELSLNGYVDVSLLTKIHRWVDELKAHLFCLYLHMDLIDLDSRKSGEVPPFVQKIMDRLERGNGEKKLVSVAKKLVIEELEECTSKRLK